MLTTLREPGGVCRCLRAAPHAEFGQQVRHVVLDGLFGEEELLADLAVGHSFGDEVEDSALLFGEGCKLIDRRVAETFEYAGGEKRIEEGLAPAHPADRIDDVGASHLLEQVPGGAGHDGAEEGFVVGERREHEASDIWVVRPDFPAHLDTAPIGEVDVEDGHVGSGRRDPGASLLGGAGFADDVEVILGFEQFAHASANHLVVVEEEYAQRHIVILAGPRAGPPSGRLLGLVAMSEVAGPRRLRELLDAVLVLGSDLDPPSMLRRIVEAAVALVDARYGALGVLDEAGTGLSQFVTVGMNAEQEADIGNLPQGHGLLGVLIVDAKPLRLPDLREHPDSFGFPPNHPPMRSFLGVPLRVRGSVFGNLYLTDKVNAEAFTDVDEELIVGLATAAGMAIENIRLQNRVKELALVEDRERIARDLHDTVIQRLFASGLSLQGTARLVRTDTDAAILRIESVVDELDLTVKHIRSAIFELETARGSTSGGLRDRILVLVGESSTTLGFRPSCIFDGPVDTAVDARLAAELLATMREALSNVARHAGARRVEVSVSATDHLTLRVTDDGVGPPAGHSQQGHGLKNMQARAAIRSGTFELRRGLSAGSVLEWRIPLG